MMLLCMAEFRLLRRSPEWISNSSRLTFSAKRHKVSFLEWDRDFIKLARSGPIGEAIDRLVYEIKILLIDNLVNLLRSSREKRSTNPDCENTSRIVI